MTNQKLKTVDTRKSEKQVDEISVTELETLKAKATKAEELEGTVEDLQKSVSKLTDLEKALGGRSVEDLLKAAEKLADIEKAQAQKVLEETTDVVKGFNLFEDEQVADVAKFFVENAGNPATNLILASLEKARNQIEEFGTAEIGHDHEGQTTDVAKSNVAKLGQSVSEILKSRKTK